MTASTHKYKKMRGFDGKSRSAKLFRRKQLEIRRRAAVLILTAALAAIAQPAAAQQPAPGWFPTGEWQCGPYVRIITSTDGNMGVNFEVIGAWFNNNYTFRRGQLFYNGTPCGALGRPFGFGQPRKAQLDEPEEPIK